MIKNHRLLRIILIQILFLAVSVLMIWTSLKFHMVHYSTDDTFNIQRIQDVWHSIFSGQLPQFTNNYTLPYGIATPSIYPYGVFILLAPLCYLKNVFHVVLILFFLACYLGLNVSYYSYKYSPLRNVVSHITWASIVFAIIYVFNIDTMSRMQLMDFGEIFANALIPIVAFGWIKWYKNNNWHQMALGLMLLLFCHLITAIIIAVCLVALTLWFFNKKLWLSHIKGLLKMSIILVLVTSILWIPMMMLLFHNSMYTAQQLSHLTTSMPMNLKLATKIEKIGIGIDPTTLRMYNPTDLLCIFLSIFLWKHLPKRDHEAIVIVIIIRMIQAVVFKNIYTIPWLSQTIGQFSGRYLIEIHLILTVLLIFILMDMLPRYYKFDHYVLSIIIMALALFNVYSTNDFVVRTDKFLSKNQLNRYIKNTEYKQQFIGFKFLPKNKNEYNSRFTEEDVNDPKLMHLQVHYDYYPKSYKYTYLNSDHILSNHKVIPHHLESNGKIRFKVSRNESSINVPIATYHAQRTIIKLDGHSIKWNHSKSGMVQIHNVHKGIHTVQLVTPIMWYRWISFITTFLGFGLLAYDIYKHHK